MNMKNKKKLILLIPVVLIAGIVAYRYVKQRIEHDPDLIRVSGNMEVTDVELSFRIHGWVERRPVSEGEFVQTGQDIAALDRTELSQEVELRKREVAAARAALAELEAGARPEEIAAAEAAVARAQAEVDYRKTELARMEKLRQSEATTEQELDTSRTAYDVAMARLREVQQQFALVKEGPRKEQIDQFRSRFRQAEQALAINQTRLAYTTLTSPVSGLVLSDNVEAGEYVAAGTPIVTVADLKNIWLRAYINETDLGRVKVGQAVQVTTDTYPDKIYEGRITFIASEAEFTPKNVQTEKERVKLVYRVKITVANPDMELKPGMPADAEIRLNP